MSHVAVEKINKKEAMVPSFFEEMKALSERIRRRAFELFEGRGGSDGFAMEDWLKAERDMIRIPESEMIEQEGRFEIKVSAPGFKAADIQVTALPDALIVKASSTHKHDTGEGKVRFCEFGQRTLLRQFDMPEAINTDKVTAELHDGVLRLTAMKAALEAGHQHKAAAA